jgi:hypothetical protein
LSSAKDGFAINRAIHTSQSAATIFFGFLVLDLQIGIRLCLRILFLG